MSELGGGEHGDDTCGVGQSIQTDGGHSDETVQAFCRDARGHKYFAEVLESNVLTGGCGAADTGANVNDQNDGECIDTEGHQASNDCVEAGNVSNDAAETGCAANGDEGHNCHGDSTSEESLDVHGLLLEDGEDDVAADNTGSQSGYGVSLDNVQNDDNEEHGSNAGPQGLFVLNSGLDELFLGDLSTGGEEAFATLVGTVDLEEDVAKAEAHCDDCAQYAEARASHGVSSEVLHGDQVLHLGGTRQHTDGNSGGTEGGAGVQPPRNVHFLKQCTCQSDNDENCNENVNAAVGEDQLDDGDGADSQELCHQGALCLSDYAADLNCDRSSSCGVAHDLCKQSTEYEDHEVALQEAGCACHEVGSEHGDGVLQIEACNNDTTDDGSEDGVKALVCKDNEQSNTNDNAKNTYHSEISFLSMYCFPLLLLFGASVPAHTCSPKAFGM